MNLILGLILATIISWLNFVIVDTFLGLPEAPGVKGAETVGYSIKNRKGDLAGGFFQGNILCSPDASAGTLIIMCRSWLCWNNWRFDHDTTHIHILIHWNHSRDVYLRYGNCNIHYSRNSPSYKFQINWKNSKILWQIY